VAAESYKVAAEQTAIAAQAARSTALGALAEASRDLQWKVLQDKALHAVLMPEVPAEGFSENVKRDVVRGMLISHYSFVFELWRLGQIPDSTWQAFQVDMMEFFRQKPNEARWRQVGELYAKEFRDFVEGKLLLRPH
jgi:hypothetical protein